MLKIAQLGQPVLRQKADAVSVDEIHSTDFQQFLANMLVTMEDAGGAGLAAPQVFVSKRVFLAAVLPPLTPDGPRRPEVFINPRLTFLTEEKAAVWEGCLSFQELMVLVPRPRAVRVDYVNAQGETKALGLVGFPARVVQHEFDHLEGVLTIDRAASSLDIVKASEIDAVMAERGEPED